MDKTKSIEYIIKLYSLFDYILLFFCFVFAALICDYTIYLFSPTTFWNKFAIVFLLIPEYIICFFIFVLICGKVENKIIDFAKKYGVEIK